MSRDSGTEQPGQRTVAELLAQYGDAAPRNGRRRRRRAEDPGDTGPSEIIDRVNSESGPSRAVSPSVLPSPPPETPPAPAVPPVVHRHATPTRPQAAPVRQEAVTDRPEQAAQDHWAQRFTAEQRAGAPSRRPESNGEPLPFDAEVTAQQPMVPVRPYSQPPPRPAVDGSTRQSMIEYEASTEQFGPLVAPVSDPPQAVLPVAPSAPAPSAPALSTSMPQAAANLTTELFKADDPYRDELAAEDEEIEPADPPPDGTSLDEPEPAEEERESGRGGWFGLALQVSAGLLGGAAVWTGFRWLWLSFPVVAVAAAVAVTGCLVFLARKFSHADDRQTVLLAILVGLACTVSPVAVMLVGQ